MRGHDEQLPYSDSSMRSMYHIRDFEVYRLMQVRSTAVLVGYSFPFTHVVTSLQTGGQMTRTLLGPGSLAIGNKARLGLEALGRPPVELSRLM